MNLREHRGALALAVIAIGMTPLALTGSCGGQYAPWAPVPEDAKVPILDVTPPPYPFAPDQQAPAGPPVGPDVIPDFVTGWTLAPWVHQCALYQPSNPQDLLPGADDASGAARVPPLNWVACPSGRTGCQQLALDWASKTYVNVITASERGTETGSVQALMRRQYSTDQNEYLIWDSVAGIQAAWRYNADGSDCLQMLGDISAGEGSITVAQRAGLNNITEYRQIFGSPAEMQAKQTPDYDFAPTDIGFSGSYILMASASASPTVVSMEFDQISQLGIRDRVANTVDDLGPTPQSRTGRLASTGFETVVGDTVFFTNPTGIYAWTRGLGAQLLRASSATYVHDITADASTLAWVESSNLVDGHYGTAILYTSPFATTAAGLKPARIMNINCSSVTICETAVSQGFVSVGEDQPVPGTTSALLVRLADSAYWRVTSDPGEFWGLGKMLNKELWIPAVVGGGPTTINRVSLASLGEPLGD